VTAGRLLVAAVVCAAPAPPESIAFYSGEAREESIASGRLALLLATIRQRIMWDAGLSLWTNCYTYATVLVPAMLTAPRYFAGEIEFGVISQVRSSSTPSSEATQLVVPLQGRQHMVSGRGQHECICSALAFQIRTASIFPENNCFACDKTIDVDLDWNRMQSSSPAITRGICGSQLVAKFFLSFKQNNVASNLGPDAKVELTMLRGVGC
jgi:ABC transporter transmembrane region 2